MIRIIQQNGLAVSQTGENHMKQLFSFVLTLCAFIIFLAGCKANSQENNARTYYESLDLHEPESAIDTFIDAFQREDFFTVFLILSPSAQFRTENNIAMLNYGELIQVESLDEAKEILADTPQYQIRLEWEHGGAVSSYLFDSIMLAAKQHSAFLIDLSGEVSILRTEQLSDSSDDSKVNVISSVEGTEGNVIFRMVQAPSGRWRVQQVIVPGGDEDLIPWSVPSN